MTGYSISKVCRGVLKAVEGQHFQFIKETT